MPRTLTSSGNNSNTEALLSSSDANEQADQGTTAGGGGGRNLNHLSAAATLGATLLGSGVLAQPEACENLGILPFLLISFLAVALSHATAMMLCKTSCFLVQQQEQEHEFEALLDQDDDAEEEAHDKSLTYAEVTSKVFGRYGRLATMWAVIIMQIGCCIAYMVVIADILVPLVRHWSPDDVWEVSRAFVLLAVALVLILPLTVFVRHMSSFKYTSAITVTVVVSCALMVMANGIFVLSSSSPDERRIELIQKEEITRDDLHGPYLFPRHWFDFLKSISIVSFAYFMHFNVMPVLHTITERETELEAILYTYRRASVLSFSTALCCTGGVGLFGYLTFLNFTKSDVLLNFPVSGAYISHPFNVIKVLYAVALSFAYPIVIWEARENIKHLALRKELHDLFSTHAVISIALVLLTVLAGSLIKDLSIVFGFIGSTCTPIIAYILPSAVYMRSGAAKQHGDESLPQLAFGLGLALIPFGLTMWMMDLVRS